MQPFSRIHSDFLLFAGKNGDGRHVTTAITFSFGGNDKSTVIQIYYYQHHVAYNLCVMTLIPAIQVHLSCLSFFYATGKDGMVEWRQQPKCLWNPNDQHSKIRQYLCEKALRIRCERCGSELMESLCWHTY